MAVNGTLAIGAGLLQIAAEMYHSAEFLKLDIESLNIHVDFSKCNMWDDLFFLIPGYTLAVSVLIRVYSKGGKPIASTSTIWRPLMVVYNLAMAFFSLACFLGMTYFVATNEILTENCLAAKQHSKLFDNLVYAFYVSKYVEFADTLFLIVKGKKVSWLHWIHHMGAALDVGILYLSGFEGSWIFVLLNGFVHTVMYSYYACALMKIKLRWKSMITTLQILQFLSGFYMVYEYKNVKCVAEDPNQMLAWVYNYAYVGLILSLFLNFYYQNYVRKPGKEKTKSL